MAGVSRNPEQEAEVKRLLEAVMPAVQKEVEGMVQLLASKPDSRLLGQTEFELRDRLLRLGAQVMGAVLEERKKRGTEVPAPPARSAARRPAASVGRGRRS